MNQNHPIFAHQQEIVNELCKYFSNVHVISILDNHEISCNSLDLKFSHCALGWDELGKVAKVWNFTKIFVACLYKFRPHVVFFHMTELPAALTFPLLSFTRIRRVLWYAHTSNSFYFKIASRFSSRVATSTLSSIPISFRHNKKLTTLGQSINQNHFLRSRSLATYNGNPTNFIHVGRLDYSKNIQRICETFLNYAQVHTRAKLFLVGTQTKKNTTYLNEIKSKFQHSIDLNLITFSGHVPRRSLPAEYEKSDVFLHAFEGSLDKSLVEATFMKIPVVTTNQGYINEFGSWQDPSAHKYVIDLDVELSSLIHSAPNSVNEELERRYLIAVKRHSLDSWIKKLVGILVSDEND
jgi:glycosyltransferase involved in cell wall biosynthesis